jgi:hypothetical protein
MLFTTWGSTDLPLRGVTFATEGVEDFLEGGMKTNKQDFIGKMEGFAIQGVKGMFWYFSIPASYSGLTINLGAAKNHQQHVSVLRTDIRNEIQDGLHEDLIIITSILLTML